MMTLAEAMSCRKRLAGRLSRVRNDIRQHNRSIEGNPRDVDIFSMLELENEIFEKLVELRAAMAVANQPIWEPLLRMSEIKDRIGFFISIPTDRGQHPTGRFSIQPEGPVEWDAEIKKPDVDLKVAELERELVKIQREVEHYNHATQIAVDVPDDLLF
jgi:hypothetical protein